MTHLIGSNQHKIKTKYRFWKSVAYLTFIMFITFIIGFISQIQLKTLEARKNIISPLAISAEIASPKYNFPDIDIEHKPGVIALIKKVWGKQANIGIAVAQCESGFNPKAFHVNTNNTIDEGVFQINSIHGMPSMKEAVANITYAYTKFLEQGTGPWNSSKTCWNDKI